MKLLYAYDLRMAGTHHSNQGIDWNMRQLSH